MLFKAPQSKLRHEMGPFTIITNLPGRAIPNHWDHGYGPLARFDESILEPGGFIPMHEHRNDEIISYVSDGQIHHADLAGGSFSISPSQIKVMNAGKSFWHEEQTKPDGETARVMQISCGRTPSISRPPSSLGTSRFRCPIPGGFSSDQRIRTRPRSFETTCAFTISISKQGFGQRFPVGTTGTLWSMSIEAAPRSMARLSRKLRAPSWSTKHR